MGSKESVSSIFGKIFGKKDDNVTDEIMNIVHEGHQQGELLDSEAEMITNIIEFGDKEAHDIMTHRKNVVAIDAQTTIKDCFDFVENMYFDDNNMGEKERKYIEEKDDVCISTGEYEDENNGYPW